MSCPYVTILELVTFTRNYIYNKILVLTLYVYSIHYTYIVVQLNYLN